MARSRGKKALYEVIGKSKIRPSSRETEPLHPEPEPTKPEVEAEIEAPQEEIEPVTVVEEVQDVPETPAVQWRKKPRIVQVNSGRVEFALPYQVAIAVALAMVLAVIGSYRLGQWSMPRNQDTAAGDGGTSSAGVGLPTPGEGGSGARETTGTGGGGAVVTTPPITEVVNPPVSTGSNRIVIQTYDKKEDLVPVQQYFAGHAIVTEIRRLSGRYYLVTADKYENPNNVGTDGYKARQQIIKLGAKYKAPEGYETFAPNLFSDAFGKKFED